MCMIDDSDGPVEMISEAHRKARKPHVCSECQRKIVAGETYLDAFYRFDETHVCHKTCAHCQAVCDWLLRECGGWMYRGVADDIEEHARSGDYPMSVSRMAVGMKWNWRTPSGKMLPVPT